MPNRKKVERSANYSYYSDLLWCTVPLIGMSWYYYGARPVLLLLTALLTAYLCDCALAPLHGTGYQSHEPSSECFAALIVLLMPASISYPIVISAVIVAVLVKEAFGGEGHYPFHPAAVGVVVAGISWPQDVFSYPIPGTQLPLFGSVNTTLVEGMNATLRDGGLPSASTMNLLTGNVSAAMGTSAALVVMACGLFLLVRGHIKLSVVIPFFIFVIGLPWFFPNLNELPTFSLPWEYIRQRFYLEKYVVLSGTALFTGLFLICEPVTMPDRRMSRIIYGAALGIIVAAHEFNANRVTLPGALCIILLSADFFLPMRALGSYFHVAMNGMAASDKIFKLLDLPEGSARTAQLGADCAIACRDLHFGYTAEKETLHGLNLDFPQGSFTALVGESGCGKSTIAAVLTGRVSGYTGHVTIGGQELSAVSEASLLKNVTLVSLGSHLFKGTVADNLRMAAPDADDGALWGALEQVNLADFLRSMDGLDTPLTEGGGNLSGGQRQRLALARALLHDSPVYIFDEATSNIDVESENDIMAGIHRLAGRKTVILISHRLANVTKADNIYVLDHGHPAGQGTHEALLAQGGLYADLWNRQQALENYGKEAQ